MKEKVVQFILYYYPYSVIFGYRNIIVDSKHLNVELIEHLNACLKNRIY